MTPDRDGGGPEGLMVEEGFKDYEVRDDGIYEVAAVSGPLRVVGSLWPVPAVLLTVSDLYFMSEGPKFAILTRFVLFASFALLFMSLVLVPRLIASSARSRRSQSRGPEGETALKEGSAKRTSWEDVVSASLEESAMMFWGGGRFGTAGIRPAVLEFETASGETKTLRLKPEQVEPLASILRLKLGERFRVYA